MEPEELKNCCVCGISFEHVQKCVPIFGEDFGDIGKIPVPMACSICYQIEKMTYDLKMLKLFVKDRTNLIK
jgi:hypothetical protein